MIEQIPPFCADTLVRLPALLENPDDRVRRRLFPQTYDDPTDEQEWRRLGAPELAHLFQSRAEVVAGDLAKLKPGRPAGTLELIIPAAHRTAWLSSLNAARLALFEQTGLEAGDMTRDPGEVDEPDRAIALLRIHVLAWLQEALLES